MRLNRRIGVALIVAAAAVLLPNAALGISQTVTIRSFAFMPQSATIAPGESITWSNADGTAHTATSNTGAFDTGVIAAGATSKTVPFANAGTYAYRCSIHPSMTGTITVQSPQPTPVPTVPPTPVPTVTPTSPPPTPVPTVPATPAPTAAGTPRPSLLTQASPSAARAAPAIGDGPGSLLAVGAVTAAAALAGLAFYLYRRR